MAAIEWKVLFVVSVEPNSPAWNAGIRDGDFIVAFNGVSVESSDDLFKMLTKEKIGIFQDVTVIRQDKKIDLRVYAGGGADACVMQEVIPRIIQFGFEEMKLRTIEAELSPRNLKSVRLLEKNNFTLAAVNEENPDSEVYALRR